MASLLRLVALALIWGSSFLWIKLGLDAMAPSQMVFARLALASVVLLTLSLLRRGPLPRDRRVWAHLALYVLIANVLPFTLFAVGEQTVDSGLSGVINSTTPLWAVPVSLLFGRERRLSLVNFGGVALGFLGVLVIFAPWRITDIDLGGALACLVAAASYGVAIVYAGRFLSNRGVPPLSLATAQMVTATAVSALLLPFAGTEPVRFVPVGLLAVAVLGVFGTGIAFVLQHAQIAREGATAATMVGYLLPVVSVLLGAVFLGETLNVRVIIGMAVVLVGVGMTRWRREAVTAAVRPEPERAEHATIAPVPDRSAHMTRP
ncbi:MAG: EamA family transporter [Kutzneria sp.]|nr:EamA family transporter [Kutzneria sp.]MBV9843476.1 EamA family transporter [Kutzneria sp.]